jgi:hypothetical protein
MQQSTPTVIPTFGMPINTLPRPEGKGYDPAPWWSEVANQCRRYPDMWIPVSMAGIKVDRLRTVPGEIRSGKLAAFRTGSWDAAWRNEQLYVKCEDTK